MSGAVVVDGLLEGLLILGEVDGVRGLLIGADFETMCAGLALFVRIANLGFDAIANIMIP